MKRFLLHVAALLGLILSASGSFAQGTGQDTILARIAYTNSDRRAILAKTIGSTKVDTLFTTSRTTRTQVTTKNLSVLASTKDGKSLLICGKAIFTNPLNNSLDSAWAIARIDSPFTNAGGITPFPFANPPIIGGAKVLHAFTNDQMQNTFFP